MTERRKVDPNLWSASKGIACPKCECRDSRVQMVRNYQQQIRRWRICRACGNRWATREVAED